MPVNRLPHSHSTDDRGDAVAAVAVVAGAAANDDGVCYADNPRRHWQLDWPSGVSTWDCRILAPMPRLRGAGAGAAAGRGGKERFRIRLWRTRNCIPAAGNTDEDDDDDGGDADDDDDEVAVVAASSGRFVNVPV